MSRTWGPPFTLLGLKSSGRSRSARSMAASTACSKNCVGFVHDGAGGLLAGRGQGGITLRAFGTGVGAGVGVGVGAGAGWAGVELPHEMNIDKDRARPSPPTTRTFDIGP